eukprot:g29318.t1
MSHGPGRVEMPQDCLDSLSFNVERCCDLVQSETGDQACWQGTHHSFEHCCQPRAGEAGASAYEGLPSLPEFGEGCWDAEQLITFARCCGTPGVKESRNTEFLVCWCRDGDYCFVGEYTYGRCCTGLHPIPRTFLDVPLEHELVRCLREARDGGISSNGSYEECNGRYFHVSAVLYRYAEFESCSEEAMAGWFAPLVDVGQHYIWPKYRQLNDTHMRVSPLNARKRPYPKFEGSWLSYRPAADALLRQQQKLQNYFEFVLTEHKTLRLDSMSCGVLLALTLPILTASVLLALGVQAAKPLALQSSVMRLGMPRPLCFDVFRIITSIFIVAVHVKDHYSFPDLKDDSDNRIYNYVISAVEATPVNSLAVMLLVLLELRHLDAIGSARLAVSGPLSYLRELTKHLLRRWVLIMSIVGIWLYFYIAVFIQEVEIPNIGKSKFLYIWFWRNRLELSRDQPLRSISCQRPVHLLPTVLLLHEAAHAYETPCHNLNIFEAFTWSQWPRRVSFMAVLWVLTVGLWCGEAYRIAVFNYPSMGGSGVGDCGDETVNLRSIVHNSLVSTGAEIEESITSFSQSGFDSLLYACNVFIMPEMESSSPDPADTSFFPASAQVSLLQWVEAGGMLISSSTSWTTLTRSSSSTTSSSSSSSSTSSTMSTSEAKPISAAQLEEMEAQRKEEAAAAVQKGHSASKEESAAELEVSSDLLAEAAASSGISGPILLSMGSLNDQAVANLKTDHPLAQGRRLASALKSQAVSINFRDETGKKISVKNLQTPMKIILKVQDASARCAYWDEVNSQWSEEGVTTSDEADQDGDLSLESFEDLSAKEIAPPRPTTLPPCSNHPTPPTQRAPSAYSEMEVEPMRFSRTLM